MASGALGAQSWSGSQPMASGAFSLLLQRCGDLAQVKQLHAHMVVTGLACSSHALSKLLDVCALLSAGGLAYAFAVFPTVRNPITSTCNALIRGSAQGPDPKNAILVYTQILSLRPDPFSLSFAMKACARLLALPEARQLHDHVFMFGFVSDPLLQTTVMDVYAKSGVMDDACKV